MTVKYEIDDRLKVITATLSGDAIDSDLADEIRRYLSEIKGQSQYDGYNEIIDVRTVRGFKLDARSIRELAQIAASYDKEGIHSKLAVIATSMLAFGFAKIYEIARNFNAKSGKEVHVFKNSEDAHTWFEEGVNPRILS